MRLTRKWFRIKQLPNIISVFRILISCSLLVLKNNSVLFLAAYILCGISDVLDGYIARRYKWETRAGASLDSVSDLVFYAIVFYLLFFTTDIVSQTWFVFGIAVVFVLRITNFLITKMKFDEWAMLHSWANKATGLCLFLCIPFVLMSGSISFIFGIILFIVASVSAIEEMIILLSSKEYDVNRKSYFV